MYPDSFAQWLIGIVILIAVLVLIGLGILWSKDMRGKRKQKEKQNGHD